MNRRFPLDNSLLVPLLIGIVSLLGICLVFASVKLFRGSDAAVVPTSAATPFKYLLLATETAVPTPGIETSVSAKVIPDTGVISAETMSVSLSSTEVIGIPAEVIVTTSRTRTPAPILTASTPMRIGTYDDTDPLILRMGNWTSQQDVITAYNGTLLNSTEVGNYLSFRFTGQRLIVGYQADLVAGEITVRVDGAEAIITQSEGGEWISEELGTGTHVVIITHASGVSVNLDYIDIS